MLYSRPAWLHMLPVICYLSKHIALYSHTKLGRLSLNLAKPKHIVPVARLEAFRALKLSRLENFRALKSIGQIGGV